MILKKITSSGIPGTYALSIKIICRPRKSRDSIPLNTYRYILNSNARRVPYSKTQRYQFNEQSHYYSKRKPWRIVNLVTWNIKQCFGLGSGWMWVFSPIRIRTLKTQIPPYYLPCIQYGNL